MRKARCFRPVLAGIRVKQLGRSFVCLGRMRPREVVAAQNVPEGYRDRRAAGSLDGARYCARFLRDISRLAITIDASPNEAEVLTLARRHRLTVYDAAYLELAGREALQLATLDEELAAAARAEQVALVGRRSKPRPRPSEPVQRALCHLVTKIGAYLAQYDGRHRV
jgi:predicted nucleic acid-binding protein